MNNHKGIVVQFLVLFLLCMECDNQFVSGDGDGKLRCIEREREALLRFKKGLIDEYGVLLSWGSEDNIKECCKWKGVRCSKTTGHVIGLLLGADHSQPLRGKISSALLELHHLNYLDLSFNDFGGSSIPEFIGSIKNLQLLNLKESNFSGVVPSQLANLTDLQNLDLSYNFMRSENLNWLLEILKLRSLQELHLSGCIITDATPQLVTSPFVNSSSTLSVLDLSDNKLTNSAIDWLFDIKMSPFRTYLRELYLPGNKLDSLPATLGQLPKLEVLDVSFNSLQGTISGYNFKELHNLKVLDLSFNPLTTQIAPDWNPPFQLYVINLAGCSLGPHFPRWIQTQRNFTWLDLSCAGISDEVPKWFWNLSSSLQYLNISNNQITGILPDLSSNFIHTIDMSCNEISGPIPLFHPNTTFIQLSRNVFSGSISSICTTRKLLNFVLLDLSSNQLAGELPTCWEKVKFLRFLNLANNTFSGEIPHALGSLRHLRTLHLRDNNFSGELPSTLKNCRNLVLIEIGGNKLTGNIPTWIGGNFKRVIYLILRQNRFYGSIPLEICSLTKIRILDLSNNNISGKIPHCFNNFTSIVERNLEAIPMIDFTFNLSYTMAFEGYNSTKVYIDSALVHWKGLEFEYPITEKLLKLIDLSSNRLHGTIPETFSSLRGLISLNLSRNSLTGNIITNISQMKMLEVLDLSRNQLFGEIPIGLADLQFLIILDLAYNNLSGKIPSGNQLQTFDALPYVGNSLCGHPLPLCRGDILVPSINNQGEHGDTDKQYDGFTLSYTDGFCIFVIFGFIVGFWAFIGTLVVKESWRSAYFNFLDGAGVWLYVITTIFLKSFRRS